MAYQVTALRLISFLCSFSMALYSSNMEEDDHLELPVELHLQHQGDAKYIVIGIWDKNIGKKYIRYGFVSIDLGFHSDIAEEYAQHIRKESKSLTFEVLGGGIVTVFEDLKKVKTYGTSGGYGSCSLKLLKYVVSKAFPDYERDVTITRYIRG